MKIYISILGALLALIGSPVFSQQFPTSTIQILKADPFNPGRSLTGDLHQLSFNYQQRSLPSSGYSSASQFLQYLHKPIGKNKTFCWGFRIVNDKEHTEGRLALSPQISAKVFENDHSYLALGISAGILNWTSNYLQSRIYDGEDPHLITGNNFIELDAGLGATFFAKNEAIEFMVGVAANQLPSNLITKQLPGLRLLPHYNANASLVFSLTEGFNIGPRIFYRNTLGQSEATLRNATTDIGLIGRLEEKDMWIAGSYRINQSALNAGLGFRIAKTDTLGQVEGFANFLDLNFGFTYPMADASAFGPTAEIGIAWTFGKRKFIREINEKSAQPFWQSDDWMTNHRVARMDPNGPEDLMAVAEFNQKAVYISYSFPDISRRYIGDASMIVQDSLLYRIGMEWKGVDGLLENIPAEVIPEAFWPDTTDIIDPENLEPLKKLSWIELSAFLRGDEERVHFNSDIIYVGELGTNNETDDTLFIPIVFNGLDTTLGIRVGSFISHLELAALKLHAMRKKLEYELKTQLGDNFRVVWETEEGEVDEDEVDDYRIPIMIHKLRIIPNNPQMQYFQENVVELKFLRDRKFFKEDEEEDFDRELMPSKEEELGVEADDQ